LSTALGVVPTVGRERLSRLHIAGEPLFVHAARTLARLPCIRTLLVAQEGTHDAVARALTQAQLPDVEVVEDSGIEPHVRALSSVDVAVVHDPLCPLTSVAWVRELVDRAVPGVVLVAVLPVVDTLKATKDGVVTGTVDRAGLQVASSPIVLAAHALVEAIPFLADPVTLVTRLRSRHDIELVAAPDQTRRVEDPSGVQLLAALEALTHGVREG
jgi:2-C-methyl-D-erythritol 4-phosphate cytidylyltransferase